MFNFVICLEGVCAASQDTVHTSTGCTVGIMLLRFCDKNSITDQRNT